jgi:DNA-binding NarL/FixJ family response regulator
VAVVVIRVAVIDDHPAIADGIVHMLEPVPDMDVVAAVRTLAEGQEVLSRGDVDVALVDVRLSDGVGLTLVEEASRAGRPAALVLSSFGYAPYVAAALRSGARGFLLKTSTRAEVEGAIRLVANGGTSFTAEQLRQAQRPMQLGERERSVIALLIESRSNDEIALGLGLSRKTVEATLTKLFDRFGALSRTELAIRAKTEGWLDV